MPSIVSQPRYRAVILSEAPGDRSRENIVVTQTGTAIPAGSLLTQTGDAGAGSFSVDAGSTGNPTAGTITVGAAAMPGTYVITFTAPTKFDVEDPNGVKVGSGTTGVAFSKAGLGFTLTAGATPAVAGDTAKIVLAAGTKKYVLYTANGAAGPADAVCPYALPAKTGDTKVVAYVRDAELNRYELSNLDAAGEADLLKKGLLVRGYGNLPTVSTPAL
jgi:hypothetical protein